MNLLTKIQKCSRSEVFDIIEEEIKEKELTAEKGKMLGLAIPKETNPYKGFISRTSFIKYNMNSNNYYSMRTKDYFFKFALFIQSKKVENTNQLICLIYEFINNYFGGELGATDFRDEYFNALAYRTTGSYDEYFEKLENLEIGELKNRKVAMATERAAIAQNLLSLFNIESYYCLGTVYISHKETIHCFNIIKIGDKCTLVDFSMPSYVTNGNKTVESIPFYGEIESTSIDEVLLEEIKTEFSNYAYEITPVGIKKTSTNKIRSYTIGNLKLDKVE